MAQIAYLKKNWWIIFVFLLSFLIRVYKVSELPYGFDGDEAAVGYYAYSLLTNLTDEYGNKLPLYFPSIGDYKYPGYSYLSIIPVAIFGLSVFSTRFLSVLSGSLLCIVLYFLTKALFNQERLAKVASFLAVFSPYGIIFSRGAYESNVATLLLSGGILFLILLYQFGRKKFALFSFIFFILSILTYPSVRLFLVIFLPVFYLFTRFKKGLPAKTGNYIRNLSLLCILVTGVLLIDPRGRIRADDIGIFRDPWPKTYLQVSIHEDGLIYQGKNLIITRMFHNKPVALGLSIFKRYLSHFDPVYLFATSNPNMPKYFVPDVGLFYFFEFITILLGIYYLGKKKIAFGLIIAAWALISPIPSSLSIETPSPIRALIGLPALIIISSLGIYFLGSELFKDRGTLLWISVVTFVLGHFFYFWHQYTVHDVYRQPWYSDEGRKEMVLSVSGMQSNFKKVIVKGDPYIHFLFYNRTDPKDFLSSSVIQKEELGKWERVETYKNIIFKMPDNCPKIGRAHVLYVCEGEEIPQNSILHRVIRTKDGKAMYLLIEFIPYSQKKVETLPERVRYMVDTDLSFADGLLSEDSGRYW